ncbi:MAG: hypothetical protein CMF50_09685 [Legionellales bacterium]|nr:hypothetical protein [Legionellales bacterium]|tara:strand:- start:9244 stop:11502 length:2259 start_codon:yes stop_codon:yes gene_type:complete
MYQLADKIEPGYLNDYRKIQYLKARISLIDLKLKRERSNKQLAHLNQDAWQRDRISDWNTRGVDQANRILDISRSKRPFPLFYSSDYVSDKDSRLITAIRPLIDESGGDPDLLRDLLWRRDLVGDILSRLRKWIRTRSDEKKLINNGWNFDKEISRLKREIERCSDESALSQLRIMLDQLENHNPRTIIKTSNIRIRELENEKLLFKTRLETLSSPADIAIDTRLERHRSNLMNDLTFNIPHHARQSPRQLPDMIKEIINFVKLLPDDLPREVFGEHADNPDFYCVASSDIQREFLLRLLNMKVTNYHLGKPTSSPWVDNSAIDIARQKLREYIPDMSDYFEAVTDVLLDVREDGYFRKIEPFRYDFNGYYRDLEKKIVLLFEIAKVLPSNLCIGILAHCRQDYGDFSAGKRADELKAFMLDFHDQLLQQLGVDRAAIEKKIYEENTWKEHGHAFAHGDEGHFFLAKAVFFERKPWCKLFNDDVFKALIESLVILCKTSKPLKVIVVESFMSILELSGVIEAMLKLPARQRNFDTFRLLEREFLLTQAQRIIINTILDLNLVDDKISNYLFSLLSQYSKGDKYFFSRRFNSPATEREFCGRLVAYFLHNYQVVSTCERRDLLKQSFFVGNEKSYAFALGLEYGETWLFQQSQVLEDLFVRNDYAHSGDAMLLIKEMLLKLLSIYNINYLERYAYPGCNFTGASMKRFISNSLHEFVDEDDVKQALLDADILRPEYRENAVSEETTLRPISPR